MRFLKISLKYTHDRFLSLAITYYCYSRSREREIERERKGGRELEQDGGRIKQTPNQR
jgi:hypothetical protein